MNTFCEHHQNSIKFGYRCFDRILLNGLIQPFQQPALMHAWYVSLISPRQAPLQPLSFILTFWPLCKYPPTNTAWLRFGTTFQN